MHCGINTEVNALNTSSTTGRSSITVTGSQSTLTSLLLKCVKKFTNVFFLLIHTWLASLNVCPSLLNIPLHFIFIMVWHIDYRTFSPGDSPRDCVCLCTSATYPMSTMGSHK